MHFVPFPSLTEIERFTGLAPVDRTQVAILVCDAVPVSGMADVRRVRLIQRSDGPIYIVSGLRGYGRSKPPMQRTQR